MATSELFTLVSIGLIQLLAVISPGPSFLITARTAVAQSRADGLKVALGLGAGTVIWSSAALLGLNAVFHAVPALFMAMKIAGALFLIYIAWMIFRHAAEPLRIEGKGDRIPDPFVKGFLTQISNPKVAVFFGSGPVRSFYLKAKAWIDRITGLFLGALGLRLLWSARDAL